MARVEYADLLGQLRTKLIRQGLLQPADRRKFVTEYKDVNLLQRAIRLINSTLLLESEGVLPQLLLESLITTQGIENLESILLKTILLPALKGETLPHEILEKLTKFAELQFVASVCARNEALQSWIVGKDDATFEDLVRQILDLNQQERGAFKVFSKILESSMDNVQLVTDNFSFSELFAICDAIKGTDSSIILLKIFLWKFGTSHRSATWGQVFNQLDFICQGGISRAETEQEWEIRAATALYEENNLELSPPHLAAPELRKNAGGFLLKHNAALSFGYKNVLPNPSLLDNQEQAKLVNYLEDPQHPLAHLFTKFGVEVEALRNPYLRAKYDLISDYVSLKGSFDYEFSLRYVHQVDTLIAFYRKIFDSGLLDLLQLRDDSVHWNVGTQNKDLTIKTFSMMMLTGLVSTGRKSESIRAKTFFHNENGGRYEWKQGNLLHSECFTLGAETLYSLVCAQKAYERSTQAYGKYGKPPMTEDQEKLSNLYASFLQKSEEFLNEVSHALNQPITNPVLSGDVEGMSFSADVLLEAFPTIDSFIDIDPATQLAIEEEHPTFQSHERQFQHAMRLFIVAKAREITNEIHHEVRKVFSDAEEEHSNMMLGLALEVMALKKNNLTPLTTNINFLVRRFPREGEFYFPGGKHWSSSTIYLELYNRFSEHLKKPGLAEEELQLFKDAMHRLVQIANAPRKK